MRLSAELLSLVEFQQSWSLLAYIAREDGKRPDGMSLIPWEEGRPLLWDFTCSDTMALSHRDQATSGPGEVACTAESLKMR